MDIVEHKARFIKFLKKEGIRYTQRKSDLLDEMYRYPSPFFIEDFLADLQAKGKLPSRATVYRLVKNLLQANLIQRIPIENNKVVYEVIMHNKANVYAVCNVCGRFSSEQSQIINNALNIICQSIAYKPQYQSLHIYGVCQKCS